MADDKLDVAQARPVAVRSPDDIVDLSETVGGLVHDTMNQLRAALDTSKNVGEPITLGDTTVVPLFSTGMGFGAGGGGAQASRGDGGRVGVGAGGGGVRPIALIISGPDGVRIQSLEVAGGGLDRLVSLVDRKLDAREEAKETKAKETKAKET